MPVPRKVSIASIGRIHNRLSFDVEAGIQHHLPACGFTHGHQQRMKIRIVLHAHGLQSSRSVHVCNRGKLRPRLRQNLDHADHVRMLLSGNQIKPLVRFFHRARGSKRTEGLALLHHSVDSVAHLRVSRIGQNAAIAQRSRTVFHASAEPCDYPSIRNQLCCGRARGCERIEALPFDLAVETFQRGLNIARGVARPKERSRQPVVGNLLRKRTAIERCSQRHAVVAGHGLHIHFIEQPRAHQLSVRRAVQCNASCQRNPPQSRLLSKFPADVKDCFIQALLQRGSHIFMIVGNWVGRSSARNQVFIEICARGRIVLPFLARLVQLQHTGCESSRRREAPRPSERTSGSARACRKEPAP